MNIFAKVTWQAMWKNKTRTVVTIIGIILSAAMICAVTTFASSMRDFLVRGAAWEDGSWHGSHLDGAYDQFESIVASNEVEQAVYVQQLGYAEAVGSTNENKPYLYVLGAGGGAESLLPIHLISGRFPENAGEILLPEHLSSNGDVSHKLGDVLTLGLGQRVLDGWVMGQNNPNYVYEDGKAVLNGEQLQIRESRTYTVVGFYERLPYRLEDYAAPGYTAFTAAEEDTGYPCDIYFSMKDPQDVYEFMARMGFEGPRNTDVLLYMGSSQYDGFSVMLTSLSAVVIGLIMFGSVALIYNAFSISVSERTKQFGLLASIGATRKQLKSMVLFEAMAVAAIGVPIGVTAGIAGIGVTLYFVGNKFTALGMPVSMELSVSWLSVVIAVAVALVTVLISAWIPSRRATRVSAVEAIRLNVDIRPEKRRRKTSWLTYKLFGLPGVLAGKYYRRSKKKYRATVVSLFMSVVLFVSASAFTEYLMESVTGSFATDTYDLYYADGSEALVAEDAQALLKLMKQAPYVTAAAYTRGQHFSASMPVSVFNHGVVGSMLAEQEDETARLTGFVNFIPDEEFKALLRQYKLQESEFMNPEDPKAITVDGSTYFDPEKEKYTTVNLIAPQIWGAVCSQLREIDGYAHMEDGVNAKGEQVSRYVNTEDGEDILELPYEQAYITFTMRSGKTVYTYPYYVRQNFAALNLIYPESLYDAVIPQELRQEEGYYRYYITSSDHAQSYKELKSMLADNGYNSAVLSDYAAEVEEDRNLVIIIQVFSYGFIALISLIAAANVFNTISTNIILRRREFAMLKSVGMSARAFNRMMGYECLLYGVKALLPGLPVSYGVTYLIYLSVMEGYETVFALPWGAVGIAVCSVFTMVFITMMYAMDKIKKEDPIAALKNENI